MKDTGVAPQSMLCNAKRVEVRERHARARARRGYGAPLRRPTEPMCPPGTSKSRVYAVALAPLVATPIGHQPCGFTPA